MRRRGPAIWLRAALNAIKGVPKGGALEAVEVALKSIYLPWMEEGARQLQGQVTQQGYPGPKAVEPPFSSRDAGMVVFFVDGLRFDLAQKSGEQLEKKGIAFERVHAWSALPSVTATVSC